MGGGRTVLYFFSQGSFEFAERKDNSKDNCSVFLSVVFSVLQWKIQLFSSFTS